MRNCPRTYSPFAMLLVVVTSQTMAFAHLPDKVSQETRLFVDESRITVRYRSMYGETLAAAKMVTFDSNRDGTLSHDEESAVLSAHRDQILPNVRITLDTKPLTLSEAASRIDSGTAGHLACLLIFQADISEISPGRHALQLEDQNYPGSTLGEMGLSVLAGEGCETISASRTDRSLKWEFLRADGLCGDLSGLTNSVVSGVRKTGPSPSGTRSNGVDRLLRTRELTPPFVLSALLLAAGLGTLHALSPGHGKAMVAAYLVGSKGRIRDAVILGGVVTLTHVGSVVVLGAVALLLSEFILPQQLYPWMGLVSGCLIWAVGFWMLARKKLGHHEHAHHDHEHHDHGHAHDHGHSHLPEGNVTLGGILALGISGGMVPCPSALVVLLGAVALRRIAFGLALILAFSLGLAAVLILIGTLAMKSVRFMMKGRSEAKLISVLPVISAAIIMLVGTWIAVRSLLEGGILGTTY